MRWIAKWTLWRNVVGNTLWKRASDQNHLMLRTSSLCQVLVPCTWYNYLYEWLLQGFRGDREVPPPCQIGKCQVLKATDTPCDDGKFRFLPRYVSTFQQTLFSYSLFLDCRVYHLLVGANGLAKTKNISIAHDSSSISDRCFCFVDTNQV